MRPAPFDYEEPTDLRQAFQGLKKGVPFAGGQSLMPALRMRQLEVNSLISLEKIVGLKKKITYTTNHIQLGALTTIRDLLDCHVIRQELPWLSEAASKLGDVQVRNLATVVGNICWSDPRANMSIALLASQAEVIAVDKNLKERFIPIEKFFIGFQKNVLNNELVTCIKLPRNINNSGCYKEFSRQPNDLALVNVCVIRTTEHVVAAVGGTSNIPLLIRLKSKEDTNKAAEISKMLSKHKHEFESDQFGSDVYKLELAENLISQTLKTLEFEN